MNKKHQYLGEGKLRLTKKHRLKYPMTICNWSTCTIFYQHSLITTGKMCDARYHVKFTKEDIIATNTEDKVVL